MQSNKKAAANSKAAVNIPADNAPKYEGIATLHVMAVRSIGKLLAYFRELTYYNESYF